LGTIESCRSKRVGILTQRLDSPNTPRTGDHTVESRLWAKGPGIPRGGRLPAGANVLDIAPTVLGLLDVPVPDSLDGRQLLGASSPA
jgi:predicted AlkP superfamily phosphohydrolase/phosphomutase